MRKEVVLIKGWADIARKITVAEIERLNADNIVAMTALRWPQFLPTDFQLESHRNDLFQYLDYLLDYWRKNEREHLVLSEYASALVDRYGETMDRGKIVAVEGNSLKTQWFYESVKVLHKQYVNTVVECYVYYKNFDTGLIVEINGDPYNYDQAIDRLKPSSYLG